MPVTDIRPSRFFTAVLSTALLVAAPALSDLEEVRLGSGYVFAPYGQFHFAYQSFDDGQETTENIVDITNSNSRFGFYIKPEDSLGGLSFHFETGLGFRASSSTSQATVPDFWDWSRTDLRKVQVIHESGWGTLKLGQGSMPTDGAAEADLGGTVVVAKSTIPEANGSYILREAGGALSGIAIKDAFNNFDGARRLRFRYDSPRAAGFSLSGAYGEEVLKSGVDDSYYELALRFDGDFDDVKVKGAIGVAYADANSGTTRVAVGSVSVLDQGTGLNLSVAAGKSSEGANAKYVYLKGGWNTKIVAVGTTKFVIEGFWGQDYVTRNSDSTMWGMGVIQEFDRQNLELYGGYRAFSYDDTTPVAYQDAAAVQIGARFRF